MLMTGTDTLKKDTAGTVQVSKDAASNAFFQVDAFNWLSGRNEGIMGPHMFFKESEAYWDQCTDLDNPFSRMQRGQFNLITHNLDQITAGSVVPSTLADYGCGNEFAVVNQTLPFVQKWVGKGLQEYAAIDLFGDFAVAAAETIGRNRRNITCSAHEADFMRQDFSDLQDPLFGLCLGKTVYNAPGGENNLNAYSDLVDKLRKFKKFTPANSNIAFGIDVCNDEERLKEQYLQDAHKKFSVELMHRIKRELLPDQDGFLPDAWEYAEEGVWHPQSHQWSHVLICTEDQEYEFMGHRISHKKGDRLVQDNSYCHPVADFQKAALEAGCTTVSSVVDHDEQVAIVTINTGQAPALVN